jgi:hypothetical protein
LLAHPFDFKKRCRRSGSNRKISPGGPPELIIACFTFMFAERWIRSVCEEGLDKLLITDQAHLWRVMREYIAFFNTARSHRGLEQYIPISKATHETVGPVRYCHVLGGIIHDYYRDAA